MIHVGVDHAPCITSIYLRLSSQALILYVRLWIANLMLLSYILQNMELWQKISKIPARGHNNCIPQSLQALLGQQLDVPKATHLPEFVSTACS